MMLPAIRGVGSTQLRLLDSRLLNPLLVKQSNRNTGRAKYPGTWLVDRRRMRLVAAGGPRAGRLIELRLSGTQDEFRLDARRFQTVRDGNPQTPFDRAYKGTEDQGI